MPIGLIIGSGLAGGNIIAASSVNKKFKENLLDQNINGAAIKKGISLSRLFGIRFDDYNSIKIQVD